MKDLSIVSLCEFACVYLLKNVLASQKHAQSVNVYIRVPKENLFAECRHIFLFAHTPLNNAQTCC